MKSKQSSPRPGVAQLRLVRSESAFGSFRAYIEQLRSSGSGIAFGLLANYYQDCPASHGPHAAYLQSVIRRALRGDEAAMRLLIMHKGIFSTGDNEGFSEVPEALLRTLGDVRYAAFVTTQSAEVRDAALGLLFAHTQDFARTYPRTAKLYHAWIASQRHTSNPYVRCQAWRASVVGGLVNS